MLKANGLDKNEYLEYKGRPLVRKDDEIIYGDMSDDAYVFMIIMGEKQTENGAMPDTIMVQLCDSKTKAPKKQKMVKGLKEAFEFADAWLTFK